MYTKQFTFFYWKFPFTDHWKFPLFLFRNKFVPQQTQLKYEVYSVSSENIDFALDINLHQIL